MADQQRLQVSELHFDKFPTPSTFSCWKIRFKTQASSCPGFPSEAMLWVKEVEMVDSVDDLKSSRSIQSYTHFTIFTMLDARIASAPKKIIQNSYFKKKVSLEEQEAQKEDRFLCGRQIAYMIYDYFRVTGAHDTVLDYPDFFSITLRNDDVQELDTRWEFYYLWPRSHLDDVLESLYKLRILESDQLKTLLELYDTEIHQKKIDTWLSKVENDGEEKHRSETSITKFSHQKWEDWGRCSGYESQEIKWCWMRTRSLPSMESKRAVFERSDGDERAKTDTKNRSTHWTTNMKR